MEGSPRRLIVGISGATGAAYGVRLLEALQETNIETHLILTHPAKRTIAEELSISVESIEKLATVVHSVSNIGASIASGSFLTLGMVIAPCSIRTASAIAYCQADNLLTRAADVILKEKRKLILLVRETPLHVGHLRALTLAAESGAMIMPPVPAFYTKPKTIDDIVTHTVGRVLDVLEIHNTLVNRWG